MYWVLNYCSGRMTAELFWQFYSSSYNMFYLPEKYKNELKKLVDQMVEEKTVGKKEIEIKYMVNLYKIRKSLA